MLQSYFSVGELGQVGVLDDGSLNDLERLQLGALGQLFQHGPCAHQQLQRGDCVVCCQLPVARDTSVCSISKVPPAYREDFLSKDSVERIWRTVGLGREEGVSCKSQIEMAQTRTPAAEV